jgi:hypothetical protein
MRRLALLVLASSLPMLACGSSAAEGGKCDTNGFLCADATAALECKSNLWVKLPCRGPTGCKREGDVVKCDMSLNEEGDNCASSAQGRGLCTPDMKGTLECREGKLVKTNTCRSCTVTGDQVVCSP